METKRLVVALALFASACGPSSAAEGSEVSSTTETSTTGLETGDDACPELIFSDPGGYPDYGDLEITSLAQANALPPYTRIDGTLRILAVPGLVDLSFLSCLREVRGGLSIANNPDLETLDGLQRLSEINSPVIEYATFFIVGNPNLRNLDGLSGLEALPRLEIEDNPLLETTDGLANLRTADHVNIQRNEILPTIELPSIESIGFLEIGEHLCPDWDPGVDPAPDPYAAGNPGLVDLDGLAGLQSYEDLWLEGNPSLTSIDGILAASGDFNRVELNEALPYTSVAQLSGSLEACGNFDDPEPCVCETHPLD